MAPGPIPAVVDEGRRIVAATDAAGAPARLLGGAAVGMHIHGPLSERLRRSYGDLDFVIRSKKDKAFKETLLGLGYEPDVLFNRLHGYNRLLFYDRVNSRQVDVFIGTFKMCHALELDDRLGIDPVTLSPADLLLTKLQIVELNSKDVIDAVTLIDQHGFADERRVDALDLGRLSDVTRADWGWYTTIRDNLGALDRHLDGLLDEAQAAAVRPKIATIVEAIDAAPKTSRWRLRNVTGRRMPWYDLPEEVAR
jgi:hypothetical protein